MICFLKNVRLNGWKCIMYNRKCLYTLNLVYCVRTKYNFHTKTPHRYHTEHFHSNRKNVFWPGLIPKWENITNPMWISWNWITKVSTIVHVAIVPNITTSYRFAELGVSIKIHWKWIIQIKCDERTMKQSITKWIQLNKRNLLFHLKHFQQQSCYENKCILSS